MKEDSSIDKIKVKCSLPFAAIPNKIAQWDSLGPIALAVTTYLVSRGDKWEARVQDIRKRFKLGDHIWRKVAKELKTLGLLAYEKTKDGTHLVFNDVWEVAEAINSSPALINQPPVENPRAENQRAYKERSNKKIFKTHSHSHGHSSSEYIGEALDNSPNGMDGMKDGMVTEAQDLWQKIRALGTIESVFRRWLSEHGVNAINTVYRDVMDDRSVKNENKGKVINYRLKEEWDGPQLKARQPQKAKSYQPPQMQNMVPDVDATEAAYQGRQKVVAVAGQPGWVETNQAIIDTQKMYG